MQHLHRMLEPGLLNMATILHLNCDGKDALNGCNRCALGDPESAGAINQTVDPALRTRDNRPGHQSASTAPVSQA